MKHAVVALEERQRYEEKMIMSLHVYHSLSEQTNSGSLGVKDPANH